LPEENLHLPEQNTLARAPTPAEPGDLPGLLGGRGDVQSALRVVNAEEQNPSACLIRKVAYMRGMDRHNNSAFEIVRILVVGVETSGGILPVRPSIRFSLFGVKEYAV
jgi:hypothetical protein